MSESESSKRFRHWLGFGAGVWLLLFPSLAKLYFLMRAPEASVAQFFAHWYIRVLVTFFWGAGVVFIATALILENRRQAAVRNRSAGSLAGNSDATTNSN